MIANIGIEKTVKRERLCIYNKPTQISDPAAALLHILIPPQISEPERATGPLTQATGPLRSGAGVGIGMLRSAGDSLA